MRLSAASDAHDERTLMPLSGHLTIRDSCDMDLLDLLLQDQGEDAQLRLLDALDSDEHRLEEVTFNVFEVVLDRDANEARVFDVLDGTAGPTVLSLNELRRRLH